MKSRRKIASILILLAGLLFGAVLISTAIGAVHVSPLNILKMVLNGLHLTDFDPTWRSADEDIILQLRLPCVIGAALVGSALAVAGSLFQGLLRNPLADPYLIGTSSGALFGVTIAIIFLPATLSLAGFGITSVVAFVGALGAVFLVYSLARIGGRTHSVTIILAGVAINFLLTAISWFLLDVVGELHQKASSVYGFLWGQVMGVDWDQILIIAPVLLLGLIIACLYATRINAFSLGEEGAAYVGINVERDKITILTLGALLTACAVSIAGLIGFVGLVIPHIMRLTFGPDNRLLIPASALAGAIFLVLTHLLARIVISPEVLRLGILTALIGGPIFLYLLVRYRKEYAL
ncbi:FecCD family ABC transporter permease [Chloroflexota bacterium]